MKVTYYANIYARSRIGSVGSIYETREIADECANSTRVACVPFEVDLDQEKPDEPHRSV